MKKLFGTDGIRGKVDVYPIDAGTLKEIGYSFAKVMFGNETGEIYIGPYHIHPNKGPMVGATHVSSPHDFLIPLSGSFEQIETEIAQQPRIVRRGGGSSGGY